MFYELLCYMISDLDNSNTAVMTAMLAMSAMKNWEIVYINGRSAE
jgi:hypothetical protein